MRVRVPMACSLGLPKLGSSREGRTTLPLPLMRRRPIRTRDPAGAMPCVYMSVACMNSSSKRTTSPSSTRAASLQGWLCFEPLGSHSCQGRENTMLKLTTISTIHHAVLSMDDSDVQALAALLSVAKGNTMRAAGSLGRIKALLETAGGIGLDHTVAVVDGMVVVNKR